MNIVRNNNYEISSKKKEKRTEKKNKFNRKGMGNKVSSLLVPAERKKEIHILPTGKGELGKRKENEKVYCYGICLPEIKSTMDMCKRDFQGI